AFCGVLQLRENMLVATMDAVKVPDGNDCWSEVPGDFGGIVPDVDHQPRLLLQIFVPPGNLPAPEHSKVTRCGCSPWTAASCSTTGVQGWAARAGRNHNRVQTATTQCHAGRPPDRTGLWRQLPARRGVPRVPRPTTL